MHHYKILAVMVWQQCWFYFWVCGTCRQWMVVQGRVDHPRYLSSFFQKQRHRKSTVSWNRFHLDRVRGATGGLERSELQQHQGLLRHLTVMEICNVNVKHS